MKRFTGKMYLEFLPAVTTIYIDLQSLGSDCSEWSYLIIITITLQQTFTCSNSATEILGKGVKYVESQQ